MSSAIVTGATGMLGRQIVSELSKDPKQWHTIHALSRSQKEEYAENVKHDAVDLTGDAQAMASQLKGVEGEYIFFAAYLQGKDEQENCDMNGAMLKNFFEALKSTGALSKVKRVILVTGAKQYGLQHGRVKIPMMENDARVDQKEYPPNFYYIQQDLLAEYAERHGFDWVVTYPNDVIGLAVNNFMNLATPLGLYATVCREMGGDMPFPGSEMFYSAVTMFTDSKLHAGFCAWAAKEKTCGNEAFNVVNGDAECWERLWPLMAQRFGTRIPPDQFVQRSTPAEMQSATPLADQPPIAKAADTLGLSGADATQQSQIESRIDLTQWAEREDVKGAWERVATREGLDRTAFQKAPWWFLRFVLGRNFNIVLSASKARKAGWTGYQDTWEALDSVFQELEEIKVLPKRS